MREIQIDEIKTLSFQVLQAVAAVCQEHGQSYSLTGGTLLGAVRLKGTNIKERVQLLISVAHPEDREALTRAAKELHYI